MGNVGRFEDLIARQKARALVKDIYFLCREEKIARDFGLKDQLQRSAVSIMSNIAEGYERGGATEFHRFLYTAKASCAELKSQIYVAYDVGYLDEVKFRNFLEKAEELSRIIGGLRSAVAKKKDKKSG